VAEEIRSEATIADRAAPLGSKIGIGLLGRTIYQRNAMRFKYNGGLSTIMHFQENINDEKENKREGERKLRSTETGFVEGA
jgi:hypothetical protein